MFELEDLPGSIAVIGTGVIGLELGQALHRLGVSTTLFARSTRLGPLSDPEVTAVVNETLNEELDLRLNSTIVDATVEAGGVRLHYTHDGKEGEAVYEQVIVAAGRRPDVSDLGLDAIGLTLDARGLPAWNPRTTQCGDAPIFMAGDVNHYRPLLHEASDEGRIAGTNAFAYPDVDEHDRRTPLAIAFTDPQMAIAGTRYDRLEEGSFEVGTVSFARQGRANVMGKGKGLLRVYGDRRTCTVVGAEIFGPRAEHLAHQLAWAMQQEIPVQQVLRMPVYHPVLEEGMRTALRDLARSLDVTGECRDEDFARSPGT